MRKEVTRSERGYWKKEKGGNGRKENMEVVTRREGGRRTKPASKALKREFGRSMK